MKSIAGSVLALIDGILSIIISLVFLIASLIFFIDPGMLAIEDMGISQEVVGSLIFIIFLIFAVIGCIKIYSSKLMMDPRRTTTGGIIALVIGAVTFGILSIVGGIIGIVQGEKKKN